MKKLILKKNQRIYHVGRVKHGLMNFSDLPDSDGVFSMLRRRAKDEKVVVRKAALQAIETAIRFEAPNYRKEVMDFLCPLVKVFRINPEFRILRLTFHRKSASKC